MEYDAKAIEKAKAMVAGPLGVEMEKYSLQFATAAFFGPAPAPEKPISVSSGSASLVRFGGDAFVITCHHVLKAYRDALIADAATIFQIGNCRLDPLAQLKSEDQALDYVTCPLPPYQLN